MNLESYIHEAIFEEKEKYTLLYEIIWENFNEDGFVITDEPEHEIDAILKAVAIQNLIGEFVYRVYDEVNETDYEDVVEYLANIGIDEDELVEYCENDEKKIQICKGGMLTDYSEEEASAVLAAPEVRVIVDMHRGEAEATAWGCDLTYDYVKINADYRS